MSDKEQIDAAAAQEGTMTANEVRAQEWGDKPWTGTGQTYFMDADRARPPLIVSNKDASEPMGEAERAYFQNVIDPSLATIKPGMTWVVDGALDVKPSGSPPLMILANEVLGRVQTARISAALSQELNQQDRPPVIVVDADVDVYQLIDGRWSRLERREHKNQ